MLRNFIEILTEKHATLQESMNEMTKESKHLNDELALGKVQLQELSALEMELMLTMERDEKNHNLVSSLLSILLTGI